MKGTERTGGKSHKGVAQGRKNKRRIGDCRRGTIQICHSIVSLRSSAKKKRNKNKRGATGALQTRKIERHIAFCSAYLFLRYKESTGNGETSPKENRRGKQRKRAACLASIHFGMVFQLRPHEKQGLEINGKEKERERYLDSRRKEGIKETAGRKFWLSDHTL